MNIQENTWLGNRRKWPELAIGSMFVLLMLSPNRGQMVKTVRKDFRGFSAKTRSEIFFCFMGGAGLGWMKLKKDQELEDQSKSAMGKF